VPYLHSRVPGLLIQEVGPAQLERQLLADHLVQVRQLAFITKVPHRATDCHTEIGGLSVLCAAAVE
jgi:hypothetical protein